MPASVSAAAPSDLALRVIGLVNLYRLLIPPALLGMQWLATIEPMREPRQPLLLTSACVAYFFAGILLVLARHLPWPSLRALALISIAVDALGISLILYASGG